MTGSKLQADARPAVENSLSNQQNVSELSSPKGSAAASTADAQLDRRPLPLGDDQVAASLTRCKRSVIGIMQFSRAGLDKDGNLTSESAREIQSFCKNLREGDAIEVVSSIHRTTSRAPESTAPGTKYNGTAATEPNANKPQEPKEDKIIMADVAKKLGEFLKWGVSSSGFGMKGETDNFDLRIEHRVFNLVHTRYDLDKHSVGLFATLTGDMNTTNNAIAVGIERSKDIAAGGVMELRNIFGTSGLHVDFNASIGIAKNRPNHEGTEIKPGAAFVLRFVPAEFMHGDKK